MAMNILVYSGRGTLSQDVENTVSCLRRLCGGKYAVRTVEVEALATRHWFQSTKLVVVPGGPVYPHVDWLNGRAADNIVNYVNGGGKWMGIGAGSYYASGRCEMGTGREVVGDPQLKFFPGTCRGSAFKGVGCGTGSGARVTPVSFVAPPTTGLVYHNGGGSFVDAGSYPNTSVLATYDEVGDPASNAAAVLCRVGTKGGLALLTALHLEYDISLGSPELRELLRPYAKQAGVILLSWLRQLGLDVPSDLPKVPEPTALHLVFPRPSSALWDFAPGYTWEDLIGRLEAHINPSSGRFEDKGHSFIIQRLKGETTPDASQPLPDPNGPLKLVVCDNGRELVGASFNPHRFLDQLEVAYTQAGLTALGHDIPGFGSPLIYGQVVGSTQSVLVETPKLVGALPPGAILVAAQQLSGKGRGKNGWVSPVGCLQFSLAMEHRDTPGTSATLIQHLAALAMVDALKRKPGYADLALHLKWPNDIYATDHSGGPSHTAKVGGPFSLIIGLGLNVTNASPTICVNDLVRQLNLHRAHPLPDFTMEEVLARFLARFRGLYAEFLREAAGFAPFLELYYANWLHTQQLVTLADRDDATAMVLGITPDHGLLEVVTVRPGTRQIDPLRCRRFKLQPDGNSFDTLAGLISKKA
ncbi:biotin holocarboxylase synthetase [Massospora cicadina]|nr:biotin holocarboxylase synthetase [Massospora cicadina]